MGAAGSSLNDPSLPGSSCTVRNHIGVEVRVLCWYAQAGSKPIPQAIIFKGSIPDGDEHEVKAGRQDSCGLCVAVQMQGHSPLVAPVPNGATLLLKESSEGIAQICQQGTDVWEPFPVRKISDVSNGKDSEERDASTASPARPPEDAIPTATAAECCKLAVGISTNHLVSGTIAWEPTKAVHIEPKRAARSWSESEASTEPRFPTRSRVDSAASTASDAKETLAVGIEAAFAVEVIPSGLVAAARAKFDKTSAQDIVASTSFASIASMSTAASIGR